MKAMIVFASRFGHTRTIAKTIARELARRNVTVACVPVASVKEVDLIGFDMMVVGTDTRAGRASPLVRHLCDTISFRRLSTLTVAVFGTQTAASYARHESSGADDLIAHLADRGCTPVVAPLVVRLEKLQAYLPWRRIDSTLRQRIAAFADELCVVQSPV